MMLLEPKEPDSKEDGHENTHCDLPYGHLGTNLGWCFLYETSASQSTTPFSIAMKNPAEAIKARHPGMQEIKDPDGP